MARFAAIVPAAGKSSRFRRNDRKKTFLDLKGRAVWLRSVEHFTSRQDVIQTIVVVAPDDLEWFKQKFGPNLAFMDVDVVTGGTERADSICRALAALKPEVEYVAVHDAARPLLTTEWIDRVFAAAVRTGAAILATPVTSTLKRVENNKITSTVDRNGLWQAQTPQVFKRQILEQAYAQPDYSEATDDAQLIERLGHPVTVETGSPINLKITTVEDFRMAERLLDVLPGKKSLKNLHPFADDSPLPF